jgi:hypothetical protein
LGILVELEFFYTYLICHDFGKINSRIKIFDKCTSEPWPTALGVPATVGHDVREAANGRQYWSVGPGPDAAAHDVRKS